MRKEGKNENLVVFLSAFVFLSSAHLYAQERIPGKEHYQSGSPGYMAGKEHYIQDSSASIKEQSSTISKKEQPAEPAKEELSKQESNPSFFIIVAPPVRWGNSWHENP